MENGLKTLLPQTSPPQRVLFTSNILTKEQNFFKTLKREEEEIISDPLPFPYLFFRMAPCSSLVGGYLWDPKPNHHISRVRKQ